MGFCDGAEREQGVCTNSAQIKLCAYAIINVGKYDYRLCDSVLDWLGGAD